MLVLLQIDITLTFDTNENFVIFHIFVGDVQQFIFLAFTALKSVCCFTSTIKL